MPEKWPTKKVDQSLDTIDSIDYKRNMLMIWKYFRNRLIWEFFSHSSYTVDFQVAQFCKLHSLSCEITRRK